MQIQGDYKTRGLDFCYFCGENFNVGDKIPRILIHCGHTFCTECLTVMHEKTGKMRIRCPICRKLVKGIESADRLPLNFNILYEIVEPEAGVDMQFNFAQLVAHAARTRPLTAGTIVGSGTIANEDTAKGASCLAEIRMLEIIADGKPSTPFMKFGDTIRIEMFDPQGDSIFGAIEQKIVPYES